MCAIYFSTIYDDLYHDLIVVCKVVFLLFPSLPFAEYISVVKLFVAVNIVAHQCRTAKDY